MFLPGFRIELHAPTSSTQKLKVVRKGGQFTYTPTHGNTNVFKNIYKNIFLTIHTFSNSIYFGSNKNDQTRFEVRKEK
jgi:hypothetical protein